VFARLSAAKAGDGVHGTEPSAQDLRLTAFLLAVPLMTLINIATSPATLALSAATISQIALACAFPLVALALLSLFEGEKTHQLITVALAPFALLLITFGHLNVFAVAIMLLAIMASEAFNQRFERTQLAAGSLVTLVIASVMIGTSSDALAQMTAFIGFVPIALAGMAYMHSLQVSPPVKRDDTNGSPSDIAAFFAAEIGVVALEIDRNACVQTVSPNSYDLLQLGNAELIEMAFLERVHIADKVILLSELDAVRNGKARGRFEIRIQSGASTSDNAAMWLDISCAANNTPDGIVMLIDTPAKNSSAYQPVNSTSSASSLTIVSHELRTPLNAIIGFSDLMAKGLAGEIANERQREYIELINQSGQHLLSLVNSILDLSKLENGTYELEAKEFLPEESAQFAIQLLAMQAQEKRIGLNYLPLCGLDGFWGDKRVCQQIMINLLSNAVKFTPQNGHIHFKVELESGRLVINVEDTGVGMSQEELSKAGTPFYQASGSYHRLHEGAGLGLSLVRQMAVLHGGAMEITSEQGKGTKVRVALASQSNHEKVVPYVKHKEADESVRVIKIDEERIYDPLRKTA
jgi:two-component system, cell cycle sensor histidine kinase DivJ